MRILFAGGGTGGHLYPGLAIARAVQRLDPAAQPFFVGAHRGIERDVLPGSGFTHLLLDLHPLYRQRPWENWRTLRGLASAWRSIGRLAAAERPRVVVGTGGYAAGAVLAYAATHGIPYAIQEQNSFAGLTVRGASRWAREVYLGFPEAARSMRGGARTEFVDTGNPIEPPPAERPSASEARRRWDLPAEGGTVLLVFGGSQGARALNEVVAAWVRRGLPDQVRLIWGTGKGSFDQYAGLEGPNVRVRAYLSPIADAYAAADLALTRAGAMSTAELCAWHLPTMLVPLPTAAADHQTANARALAEAGAALHVPQATLTAERLDALVRELTADPARLARMRAAAAARARPEAAERIAQRVLALARGG
jgi:UDP-N-acetylglucosamine--N-acetylmuramyl-(pentapeptide) pyrophosphoryl-undecaprenol N-acetylglucosamine transferase